jgi:hypothetical protein
VTCESVDLAYSRDPTLNRDNNARRATAREGGRLGPADDTGSTRPRTVGTSSPATGTGLTSPRCRSGLDSETMGIDILATTADTVSRYLWLRSGIPNREFLPHSPGKSWIDLIERVEQRLGLSFQSADRRQVRRRMAICHDGPSI